MKFVQAGYGHDGRGTGATGGEGYTYLVNDNVKVGQNLTLIAHSKKGRAFPTTGQILDQPQTKAPKDVDPTGENGSTRAYTQKELGVKNIVDGKFQSKEEREYQARKNAVAVYNSEVAGNVSGKRAESSFAITGGTKTEALLNSKNYVSYEEIWNGKTNFDNGDK